MDDKKLNDLIKDSASQIEVPESLRPEKIEKRLDGQKNINKKRNWKKNAVHILEAAAMLTVVFLAGEQLGERSVLKEAEKAGGKISVTDDRTEAETAVDETEQRESGKAEVSAEQRESGKAEVSAEQRESGETEAPGKGIRTFSSVSQIYEMLREFTEEEQYQYSVMERDGMAIEESVKMDIMAQDAGTGNGMDSTAESSGDYSRVNLRDASVDEGDIVKTDGEFIYIMKGRSSVVIVDADGAAMEKISVVEPEKLNESVRDLYVDKDRMILVTSGSRSTLDETETDVYETKTYSYTKILTYDISDRSNVKLLGSAEQEGEYQSSRKNGKYVYAFTSFRPRMGSTEKDSGIMPLVDGTCLEAADIYAPEQIQNTGYLVAGAVNTEKPNGMCSRKAIVSGAEEFYVSEESIFIINRDWEAETGDVTDILKFSYKDGEIRGVAGCRTEGYLNDSFSLDEYKGYLRAVVTSWKDSEEINALYVFDENLEMVGKIADIAPGETIRSARFMGDVGYFVTFRQTDPLFSVDLSDPENPQILGELKVSGFSSYLHFYGQDRLLGIGYEADEETGVTSGIKLSMFDVSDPANVTEIKRYVLKDASWCPGLSDYKAIMIDPEKNLFGLQCDENYMVFTYEEEKGFENLLTYRIEEDETGGGYGWYDSSDARGLYIGDTFYLAEGNVLRAFDMTDDFIQKEKLEI